MNNNVLQQKMVTKMKNPEYTKKLEQLKIEFGHFINLAE